MHGEAAIAIHQPPHFEAEADIPGFEDFGAAVVLDRVALGAEGLTCTGLHLRQEVAHCAHVGRLGDFLVPGLFEHLRQFATEGPDGPADRVAVNDRIHAAVDAHAAADAAGGREFGVLWAIDIATLEVEAIEAQQRRLFAIDVGRHVDRDALVRMILHIGVPQLVANGEGQRLGGETDSLRLRHEGCSE